ncbi:MAG: peptidoglycan editing factor PgeF [Oxalobacteraceae bacterium]
MRSLPIHWPDLPERVAALSTLRSGGVSLPPYDDGAGAGGLNLGAHVGDLPTAVAHNRARLRSMLPSEPVWLNQVHGIRVVDAQSALAQHSAPEADASVATEPGIVCAIMTADCMPVLLADRLGKVVGAAHAGWRGLAAGVIESAVQRMRAAGAGELTAWLGPGIGPACFEVGDDVLRAFDRLGQDARGAFASIEGKPGKYLADLPRLARLALSATGVTRVAGGEHCTMSESVNFYSFRRERVTGRMATLIWIK